MSGHSRTLMSGHSRTLEWTFKDPLSGHSRTLELIFKDPLSGHSRTISVDIQGPSERTFKDPSVDIPLSIPGSSYFKTPCTVLTAKYFVTLRNNKQPLMLSALLISGPMVEFIHPTDFEDKVCWNLEEFTYMRIVKNLVKGNLPQYHSIQIHTLSVNHPISHLDMSETRYISCFTDDPFRSFLLL